MVDLVVYHTVRRVHVPIAQLKYAVSYTFAKQRKTGMVSMHIVGEARMTRLNEQYAGGRGPTDVLSFPAQEGDFPVPHKDWGDIFVCQPYVISQAIRQGCSLKEEMTRMVVHGSLHLIGYDHYTKKEANKMFGLQEKYVTAIT